MKWTLEQLDALPISEGFRLRGLETTRLETFIDAAFAFGVSMMVISVSEIPKDFGELVAALKAIPAFAASFLQIFLIWFAHRQWSRMFGLEDRVTIPLSMSLVFVILIVIYPLKLIASSFFAWITGGWIPSEFALSRMEDLVGLFIFYGLGFFCVTGIIALLFRRALQQCDELQLSPTELLYTREHTWTWAFQSGTGLASALFAWLLPPSIGIFAGFVYFLIPLSLIPLSIHFSRKREAFTPAGAPARDAD